MVFDRVDKAKISVSDVFFTKRFRCQERKSVIIFDEVQQCPKARQAIKYLVKDGRFDYIETGSLISIRKNPQDISIPSEEHRVEMFPMNVGMSLTTDMGKYKLYIGDTGLFVTLAFWDKGFTENIIYQKLLNDKLSANMEYVYENLEAQMLRALGDKRMYLTILR